MLRCGTGGTDSGRVEIAASDIRRACLAAAEGQADLYGLRLDRTDIIGTLDLRAASAPVP